MKKRDSTVEEIKIARDEKAEERRRKEKHASALTYAKEELEERLIFQFGHGNRVRVAIRDRAAGGRVVEENNENNRRILELKQTIKELEKSR